MPSNPTGSGASRRGFMAGIGAAALMPRAAGAGLPRFAPVAAGTADTVTVPEGFSWAVLVAWGDPLHADSPDFDWATRGSAAAQAAAWGDNNDAMQIFEIGGRTVLAANNEYTNLSVSMAHRASGRPETRDDRLKSMMAHGVAIAEIARAGGRWRVLRESPLNRRITPLTGMRLAGPAAGHPLLRTSADPTATRATGTWANCATGRTPWGTFLSCEENVHGYFSASGIEPTPAERRYKLGGRDWGYGWAHLDPRFDLAREPNEPNRCGYVVEIDPADPASVPVKRTALGRFAHENAELLVNGDGRVVVYSGDDRHGEFVYRFVSDGRYRAGDDPSGLLDAGTLSVAAFAAGGRGRWIELTPETTGMDAAEICILTRLAASAAGATPLARPEAIAAHPDRAELYLSLTENLGETGAAGRGDAIFPPNRFGQVLRWRPDGADHGAPGFDWDIFLAPGLAGTPGGLAEPRFNSPDGLYFDGTATLWVQTDGNYSNAGDYAGHGNNQMLAADPASGEVRRFLTAPTGAEVTGCAWSPDRRTMFVAIQHPGERGTPSQWPGGEAGVPRSAVIAISRDDGGAMG